MCLCFNMRRFVIGAKASLALVLVENSSTCPRGFFSLVFRNVFLKNGKSQEPIYMRLASFLSGAGVLFQQISYHSKVMD